MLKDAEHLVGCYGARVKELALYFDVHEKTVEYWIRNYTEFERVVKRGRVAQGLQVAKALVSRAKGYSHPDTHIFSQTIKEYDEKTGKLISSKTEPLLINVMKHYPPDAYAANKYLAIMFRDVWTESELNINHNHSGTINHKQINELDAKDLSETEKEFLFKLNMKQLQTVGKN